VYGTFFQIPEQMFERGNTKTSFTLSNITHKFLNTIHNTSVKKRVTGSRQIVLNVVVEVSFSKVEHLSFVYEDRFM